MFWHPDKQTKTLVHGDDYVSSGTTDSMEWLEKELTKAYEIKTQKVGMSVGYKTEGKVLNRVLRCTEDGWEMEADPQHAELVVEQLGLKGDKGIGPQVCRARTRTTTTTSMMSR